MFEVGDAVTIIVDCPDGVHDERVYGKTGVIVQRSTRTDDTIDFAVKYDAGEAYLFGQDQLRYATEDEVLEAFRWAIKR